MSHTRDQVGSRMESFPPSTWTESGQTPVLPAIVKQPPAREGSKAAGVVV
jgi:hypothetical protein